MASELRKNILKVLILISSKDLQIAYQNSMPHATLSSELIGLWDLEYFPGDKDFKASFHKLEKEALSDFYKVFEGIANDIDYCVPEIDKFVETKPWKRFSEAAKLALKSFPKQESDNATKELLLEYMKVSSVSSSDGEHD